MQMTVSKSQFKPQVLEYLRMIEKTKKTVIITHLGKPVAKVSPYTDVKNIQTQLKALKGSVIEYKDPLASVGEEDWEACPFRPN